MVGIESNQPGRADISPLWGWHSRRTPIRYIRLLSAFYMSVETILLSSYGRPTKWTNIRVVTDLSFRPRIFPRYSYRDNRIGAKQGTDAIWSVTDKKDLAISLPFAAKLCYVSSAIAAFGLLGMF